MPSKSIYLLLTHLMLFSSITLLNCHSVRNSAQETDPFKTLVKAELGEPYKLDYNKARTYALCQQERIGDHAQRRFGFIIVRLSDNKVIRKGSYRMGYAQWIGDNSIEVSGSDSPVTRDDGKTASKQIIDIQSDQR